MIISPNFLVIYIYIEQIILLEKNAFNIKYDVEKRLCEKYIRFD